METDYDNQYQTLAPTGPGTEVANPFRSNGAVAPAGNGAMTNAAAEADLNRAMAEIQMASMMAKRFPRDEIRAVDNIKNACTRVGLAEKAIYTYARGGTDVTGPSIRLAESMAQQWGNMQTGVRELSRTIGPDGVGVSTVEAYCWDMQTNHREVATFQVRHWRDTKQGGYKLKDERDIYELIANQGARRKRGCILRVIPGDVTEMATQQCDLTLNTKVDNSAEAKKAMVEAFENDFGITQAQIEKRIQCRLDAMRPAQMASMKKIYRSLRDDMSKPDQWFEPAAPTAEDATAAAKAVGASNADKVAGAAATRRPAPSKKAAPPDAPAPTAAAAPGPAAIPEPGPEPKPPLPASVLPNPDVQPWQIRMGEIRRALLKANTKAAMADVDTMLENEAIGPSPALTQEQIDELDKEYQEKLRELGFDKK